MKSDRTRQESLIHALSKLHEEVDESVHGLCDIHGGRLQCRLGCVDCCVDELTVFEIEAENIRRHHGDLLREGMPHPPGACAFLDESGACRIYESRPYVCRTQGLPLRWIEEMEEDELVEMRDICSLNDEGVPIETLPEDACWTLGPFEERLAGLQIDWDGGKMKRVFLRALLKGA